MELKPTKGLMVDVKATREAVFEEKSVEVRKVSFKDDKSRVGLMTGITLAGFCEVEMPALDGRKHWYPVNDLLGEHGETIMEEDMQIEAEDDEADELE